MSLRSAVLNVLRAAVAVAPDSSPLHGLQVRQSLTELIQSPKTLSLSLGEGELAPMPDGSLRWFNFEVAIVISQRIVGQDKTRGEAAEKALDEVVKAVAKVFFDNPSLGLPETDARILNGKVFQEVLGGDPYVNCNLNLIASETGNPVSFTE